MANIETGDAHTEREARRRRDEALLKLLKTPPQPRPKRERGKPKPTRSRGKSASAGKP